jgi:tetratricopeptide (TPR) repeat protein
MAAIFAQTPRAGAGTPADRRRMNPASALERGNRAMAAGDARTAAECYRAALAAAGDHAGLYYNLGNALRAGGDDAGAEAALRRALALAPGLAAAHNNLGNLLRATGRPAEALEAYRHALHLAPHDGQVRGNLGTALLDLQRPEEALVFFAQAVAAAPGDAQARVNLAGALMLNREPMAALGEYRRARGLAPALPAALFGEAIALLTLGDWAAGWEAYEARLRDPRFPPFAADITQPRWRGDAPVEGRTLLLIAEQGLGDTLQFCRYTRPLRERGARVVLQVQPALRRLLGGLADSLAVPGAALPHFDAWCPLMSLPFAFRSTPETVPATPYLTAEPARRGRWRRRLGPRRGLRVGLAWAGNATHPFDALRSLPVPALAPLLAVRGIEAHALQPDAEPTDRRIAAHPEIADFADTAALIELMDVVISVDTVIAHLAGALGRPVWILLPYAADFRWMLERSDTPWYASARLFRQARPKDWAGPVAAAGRALGEWRRR